MLSTVSSKEDKLALVKPRAADLFKQGFYDLANELYTTAIALAPTHQAYSNRSACRCAARDYEGALADAQRCMEMDPTWAKGYARAGAAHHGLYAFQEAVRAYEKGLEVEPGNQALADGLEDALRRMQAAGGEWTVAVDGGREVNTQTRKGEVMLPQLGSLSALCAGPPGCVCAIDGDQIKLFGPFGLVRRVFNEKYKDAGSKSLEDPIGLTCDGESMWVSEHASKPKYKLQRLKVNDIRSIGDKKENPDKVLAEAFPRKGLDVLEPRGLAIVDTTRMGGGSYGERTLYVCDSGHGRVLALDPKTLEERFAVGRPGSGDGELDAPCAVAACGDLLAVADAGNHRVAIFTLRGTFLRNVGERPSKFSSGGRSGQFVRPPAHVAMADGHLFVLEAGGSSRVHVLNPETGEPRGMLLPPFNLNRANEGTLTGLCVGNEGLYVACNSGPARILCLPRNQPGKPSHTRSS